MPSDDFPFPTARIRFTTIVSIVSVGCLSLASCGSGADDTTEAQSINVGYFPLVHTVTAVHAMEEGGFTDAGLDVELHQTGGGAEAIPPLVAGELDIAYGNYTSTILGAEQGLPLRVVAGNDIGVEDHAIMTMPDSDFQSPEDLEGATIALNNLENIGAVAVQAIAEEHDIDPDTIEFVELPYPDMLPTLERGEVDGIWQVEPFKATAMDAGAEVAFELFSGPVAEMPVAGWVTTEEFAEQNPEVIEAFRSAIEESAGVVQDDRELLMETVPEFTEVDADVVGDIAMPRWQAEVDEERLQTMVDLMDSYGLIDEGFAAADFVAD